MTTSESNPEKNSPHEDIGYVPRDLEAEEAIRNSFQPGSSPTSKPGRSVPKDDSGVYIVDQIEPGQFIPDWGPVRGEKTGQQFEVSLLDSPIDFRVRYGLPKARYRAAIEFAERANRVNVARQNVVDARAAGASQEDLAVLEARLDRSIKNLADFKAWAKDQKLN